VSYRTNDRLHAVFGWFFLLFGLLMDTIAFGSWWYTFSAENVDGAMIGLSSIISALGFGLVWVGIWTLWDIRRVRREE
jgi:hypothetical protein